MTDEEKKLLLLYLLEYHPYYYPLICNIPTPTPTPMKKNRLTWPIITANMAVFILIVVGLSYPSTYLVEYTVSSVQQCKVSVRSPLSRTGLGFVGTLAGGAGVYLPLAARIIESVTQSDWREFPPCE